MNTKYLLLAPLLFIFLLSILPANFKAQATTITVTKTFTSLNYDGSIRRIGSSYDEVHDSTEGEVCDQINDATVGQTYIEGNNIVWIARAFLYFDTSAIPDDANITSATLSIYIKDDNSETDFQVIIQNGQPTYPHVPLKSGDFYYSYYIGNGGSRDTSEITGSGYWNITLNEDGMNWINKAGYTKLCLRSNRDINNQPPTGPEGITFYTREIGEAYSPKLYVTYECEGYKYVFHGPFNEETGLKDGNVTIYIYPSYGSPFNFTLDGNYTLELEEKPSMFKWKLEYNYSRVYIPLYSYEEIYIFRPADPYFLYTVEVIDFIGIHNVYIEALVSANGSQYIAERRRIPSGGKSSFCLTEFKSYSYRLICDEAIISLGTVETPQRPIWEQAKITFIVTPAMLEAEPTNYQGISLTAKRLNSTCIQICYIDNRSRTQSVNVTIYSIAKFNSLTKEYSQTFTTQQISITWNNALPDKDYLVEVQAEHADYGTLTWKIPCNSPNPPSRETINWNTIFGWIADWPVTPSNMICSFIIFAMIVLGSFKDSAFALLLGAITAGILIIIGWYSMSWAILSVIVSLIIGYAIVKGRRRWIER
mgnify:CR=1 FL=1